MLVALIKYHRRCEQHLEQYIVNETNKAVQTLVQSRMKDVLEKTMAEYIKNKRRLEEKQQRKLHSLQILPSKRSDKQKDRRKSRIQKKRRKHIRKSPEDTSIVVNLSGEDLKEEENILLSKGLSFCPAPTKLDKNQLLDNLESFFRWLCLREFLLHQESEDITDQNTFHPPSKWMPPKGRDVVLETYIKGVRREMLRQLQRLRMKRTRSNLSSFERRELKTLW